MKRLSPLLDDGASAPKRLCKLSGHPVPSTVFNITPTGPTIPSAPQTTPTAMTSVAPNANVPMEYQHPGLWGYSAAPNGIPSAHPSQSNQPVHPNSYALNTQFDVSWYWGYGPLPSAYPPHPLYHFANQGMVSSSPAGPSMPGVYGVGGGSSVQENTKDV